MLLFYIRKTKKGKFKVVLKFEPDKNFQGEFSQWISQLLDDCQVKRAKEKETLKKEY